MKKLLVTIAAVSAAASYVLYADVFDAALKYYKTIGIMVRFGYNSESGSYVYLTPSCFVLADDTE